MTTVDPNGATVPFADALWIGLGALTDTARPYAAEHGIAVWQVAELAQALRGLPLEPKPHG